MGKPVQNKHPILGGKVHLYPRPDSGDSWLCSAYFKGKNRRKSAKETSLPLAREIADDWYLELRGKARVGELDRQEPSRLPYSLSIISYGLYSAVYIA